MSLQFVTMLQTDFYKRCMFSLLVCHFPNNKLWGTCYKVFTPDKAIHHVHFPSRSPARGDKLSTLFVVIILNNDKQAIGPTSRDTFERVH